MAFFGSGSAGYNSSKTSGKTTSNSTTNSTSNTTQGTELGGLTLQSLLGTLDDNVLASLINTDFSKNAAIADSSDAMNAAINTVLQSGIGNVNSGILNTGAYNNTTRGMLANDLGARAAAEGASVRQNAIQSYAGITNTNQQTAIGSLLSALGLDQSANSSTTSNSTTRATQTTSGKSSGFNLGSQGGWK